MSEVNFRVDGKVALVTGAGRGIGLSIAKVLAEHGAKVAIQDLDVAAAEAAVKDFPGEVLVLGGDITDPATSEKLVKEVKAKWEVPNILINNAGVQEFVPWLEAKVERMEWQWRGNVLAPLLLMRACIPSMVEGKWGRVINLSSIQGMGGSVNMIGYSTTKAAIDNITKAFARDYAKTGVTVNAIAPGYFNTFRNKEQFKSDQDPGELAAQWVPMGRAGFPREAAGTALLLCSEAGVYITGQVIRVDGGLSAR